jgi:hypothetical protein
MSKFETSGPRRQRFLRQDCRAGVGLGQVPQRGIGSMSRIVVAVTAKVRGASHVMSCKHVLDFDYAGLVR